jgi:hypothetical protein
MHSLIIDIISSYEQAHFPLIFSLKYIQTHFAHKLPSSNEKINDKKLSSSAHLSHSSSSKSLSKHRKSHSSRLSNSSSFLSHYKPESLSLYISTYFSHLYGYTSKCAHFTHSFTYYLNYYRKDNIIYNFLLLLKNKIDFPYKD